jgi:hypothetical protein
MRAAQWGGSSYPLVRANKREFVMLKLVWDADAAPPVDEDVKMDEIEEFESDVFERFIHAVERCDEGWRRDDHYRTERSSPTTMMRTVGRTRSGWSSGFVRRIARCRKTRDWQLPCLLAIPVMETSALHRLLCGRAVEMEA